jgi:glycosyltransferase involved in cell wall biosynthesis
VVDDASESSPADILGEIGDTRLRLLHRSENGGPSAARATGFAEAEGRIVALLDSDNEFFPWALERAVALLAEYPEVGCVTGLYMFPNGLRTRVAKSARILTPAEYRTTSARYDSDCLGVVRREVVELWLNRRRDFYSFEFHLWFWMSLHYPQLYVDEPWGRYHTDADNQVTRAHDARAYADAVRFVEEYRPLLGAEPCIPLDEQLRAIWYRLTRAKRFAERSLVEEWMAERRISKRSALRDAIGRRGRRFVPSAVKWM